VATVVLRAAFWCSCQGPHLAERMGHDDHPSEIGGQFLGKVAG